MLHIWLIPVLVVLAVALCVFYLLMKYRGGTGVRTEGKTILDRPEDEQDLPPGQ